jgi:hypothetical protein
LVTWTPITDDACRGAQSPKCSFDDRFVHTNVIAEAEECPVCRPSVASITLLTVIDQYAGEVTAHRDKPCLEKLRLPDGQNSLIEIDVRFVEVDYLAESQGSAIQCQQERS